MLDYIVPKIYAIYEVINMPAINENLKMIRKAKGLTQEDVAKELGVTRQTISSYESNRTQPDMETLKHLSKIYDAEFNDILYGTNKKQMKHRVIKIIAIISIVDLFLCNLLQSVILWVLNNFFFVPSGPMSDIKSAVINFRITWLSFRDGIGGFSLFSFSLLCIILFVLLMTLEHPIPIRSKLKYLSMLIIGSAITILPWSFFDKIYTLFDYSYTAILNLIFAIILFGLSFIGEYILKVVTRRKVDLA